MNYENSQTRRKNDLEQVDWLHHRSLVEMRMCSIKLFGDKLNAKKIYS